MTMTMTSVMVARLRTRAHPLRVGLDDGDERALEPAPLVAMRNVGASFQLHKRD
jgi:hypothetical protein